MSVHNSDDQEFEGFPSDFVDPETKNTIGYGLAFANAIYQSWEYGQGYNQEDYNRLLENRRYAEGLQDINRYKDRFGTLDSGDYSYLNLNFNALPIIPKFIDMVVGELGEQQYSPVASAIDPTSRTSKDKERNRLYANMILKDLNETIENEVGAGFIEPKDKIPESEQEIDLHMQMSFKLDTEIAVEETLQHILKNNKFDRIWRKMIRDMAVQKRAALKVEVTEDDTIKLRRVVPENLIVPYSEQDDFSDIKYAAEIRYLNLGQIRSMDSSLTEEALFEIAKQNAGKWGNRKWPYSKGYQYYYSGGSTNDYNNYDDFLIPVLDFEFHTVNLQKFEIKENNYGSLFINKKGFHYEPNFDATDEEKNKKGKKPNKSKELIQKQIAVVYKGNWVVGTKHLLNYGLKEDMIRPKKKGVYSLDTCLSFHIFMPEKYGMENKSMVERMIPHADEMQLISLKMQQLIAKATPPGISVDVAMLQGIFKGKGTTDFLTLQDIYQQTGSYYYNSYDPENPEKPVNPNPIREIKNSIGGQLQELVFAYNFQLQQIRDITGINESRDAVSVDKKTPVATSQMALKASRNATRYITDACLNIYEDALNHCVYLIQDLAAQNRLINLEDVIGKQSLDTIKLGKDMAMTEYGIHLEALPMEEERAMLEENLKIALQTQTVRLEDIIRVREVAKTNIKNAHEYLILRQRKYQEEQMLQAQAQSQYNAQVQIQSAQAKAQSDMQQLQIEHQLKMQYEQLKSDLDDRNKEKEHQRKLDQILLEGKIKSEHIEQAAELDFEKTELSGEIKQPGVFTQPEPRVDQ